MNLELYGSRGRAYSWVIVFVHTRLKCACSDRILRPQTELQGHGAVWRKRVEVKNRLRGGLRKLLETAVLFARALLLISLQVFTHQIESRRDAQIDHDHLCRLVHVVLNRRGCGCDIVLCQVRAIISDVNRERFAGWFLVPWYEVAAGDLVCQTAFAFESQLHCAWFVCIERLEHKLMQQVIVVGVEREGFDSLVIQQN